MNTCLKGKIRPMLQFALEKQKNMTYQASIGHKQTGIRPPTDLPTSPPTAIFFRGCQVKGSRLASVRIRQEHTSATASTSYRAVQGHRAASTCRDLRHHLRCVAFICFEMPFLPFDFGNAHGEQCPLCRCTVLSTPPLSCHISIAGDRTDARKTMTTSTASNLTLDTWSSTTAPWRHLRIQTTLVYSSRRQHHASVYLLRAFENKCAMIE